MRKHIYRLKTSTLLILSLFLLAACGGGGGSAPTNNNGNQTDDAEANFTFQLVDSSGSVINTISDSSPGTLRLEITGNANFDGEIASFTSTLGSVSQATDLVSGGVASVVLSTGGAAPNAGTASVTLGGVGQSINFEIVDDGSADGGGGGGATDTLDGLALQLLQDASNSDSDITAISDSVPGVIVVQLSGGATSIAAQIVSVSSSIGTLTQTTALTDPSGRATVVVTSAGASPAAGTIVVSVDGLENESLNFEIVNEGISTTDGAGFSIDVGLFDSDVDLDNLAAETPISSVSTVGRGIFAITVTDATTGNAVEGAIVSVSSTDGALTPSSGQVLTNSNGVAAVEVEAAGADPGAAATITATLADASSSLNFVFGSVDLQLGRDDNDFVDPDNLAFVDGEIDIDLVGDLSSNGTTVLTVVIVSSDDTSTGFDDPLTVDFTSTCAAAALAQIDTAVLAVNGIAQATYQADGCEGADNITATIQELSGVTATGSLNVESALAKSIRFVSATPTDIALQGTAGGARQDNAELIFEVVDENGDLFSGQLVTAELSTTVGGIFLTGGVAGVVTQTSNALGQVSITVNSGSIPTSVRVEASIELDDGSIVSTVSDTLVVSTGLPDNNSFEIAVETLNPGGWDETGVTTQVTAFASDAFNNPVPDNTAINFTTEYGQIGASCTTTGGQCSVTWTSQNPRRPDDEVITGDVLQIGIASHGCDLDGDGDINDDGAEFVPCSAGFAFPGVAGVLVDDDDPDFPGQVYGGRSTILAYAIGEESFIDANADGRYSWIDADSDGCFDDGTNVWGVDSDGDVTNSSPLNDDGISCDAQDAEETREEFSDLPEAFLDDNEDDVFGNEVDPLLNGCNSDDGTDQCSGWQEGGEEEVSVDFNSDGFYDGDSDGDNSNGSVGNGIFNGVLCHPFLEAAGFCTKTLVNVRDDVVILMTSLDYVVGVYDEAGNEVGVQNIDVSGGGVETRFYHFSDVNNGFLGSGSSFSVANANCQVSGVTSREVRNTNDLGHSILTLTFSEDTATSAATSTEVTITVNSASGNASLSEDIVFNCIDDD